ncbi:MAG: DUF4340 domain-containing protein, partial [Clostridia bacterium]
LQLANEDDKDKAKLSKFVVALKKNGIILGDLKGDTFNKIEDKKPVEIIFGQSEEKLKNDDYGKYINGFAITFAYEFKNISIRYDGSSFCTIKCGEKSVTKEYEDFFNKLENGAKYSFNGEKIFAFAILSTMDKLEEGISEDSFLLYALDGYDIDGDTVGANNRSFVYPNITRTDVESIHIINKKGEYTAYRMNNQFMFKGAELCNYNQEKFASLVVNCTYMLSLSKITNVDDFAKYGLSDDSDPNAIVEVKTTKGILHKIIIGEKIPSGGGYYARYLGKNNVYILDNSVETEILSPLTDMLTGNLGYNISSTNDTYDINDVLLMYKKDDINVFLQKRTDITLPKTLAKYNAKQEIDTLLMDKIRFNGNYTEWKKSDVLMGISAGKDEEISLEIALERYSLEGKYSVKFGLVKDTELSAVLPSKVTVFAYDNTDKTFKSVAVFEDFSQNEKTYKEYEIPFEYSEQLRYIKVVFDSPSEASKKFIVIDEITVCADGWDAIPKETVTGIWQIMSPASYIKKGYNYAVPDPSTFSEILYGMATLVGDKVLEYNVQDEKTLEKYGLQEPEIAISYEFKGNRSYIYFSKAEENGTRYAYSTINYTGEDGKEVNLSTGIIAQVTREKAAWLSWDPLEFLDRSTFTMYIDKINTIEMEFDGKSYLFEFAKGNDGKVSAITCDGKPVDLPNFRRLYVSVLQCTRVGEYVPTGNETKTPYFRFKMKSSIKETEIIYYRVTSNKCTYEIDGEKNNFYVLFSDISTIIDNVKLLLDGKDIPK